MDWLRYVLAVAVISCGVGGCGKRAVMVGGDPFAADGSIPAPDGALPPPDGALPPDLAPDGSSWERKLPAASDYIYLLTRASKLLRFDPVKKTVHEVGTVRCPICCKTYPPVTVNSMAIDHTARAWVTYTNGELFWVDTSDASCRRAPVDPRDEGYSRMGMAFVADGPGAHSESLFVVGQYQTPKGFSMSRIDPRSETLAAIGKVDSSEMSPELTGTADGTLYGYFPGKRETFVGRIDKRTGKILQRWKLPPLRIPITGWAVAHWGGRFHIFVGSSAFAFDPDSSKLTTLWKSASRVVVGAGVSVRAPLSTPAGP